MMTQKDIKAVLRMLNANYGDDFYKGTDDASVLALWTSEFENDDPEEVMTAVRNYIRTSSYKPRIADIRKQIAKMRMSGQMTEMEAFQLISEAVDKARDKNDAVNAFSELPPILRKIVVTPSRLRDWRMVSDESFHTVVMSQIVRSYRDLAQKEVEFYSMPKVLQAENQWLIEAPTYDALPEPEKGIDAIFEEAERNEKRFRQIHNIQPNPDYADRVSAFREPMTEEEKKRVEMAENRKAEWSLK